MHLIGCRYYWQVSYAENIYFAQIKNLKKNHFQNNNSDINYSVRRRHDRFTNK